MKVVMIQASLSVSVAVVGVYIEPSVSIYDIQNAFADVQQAVIRAENSLDNEREAQNLATAIDCLSTAMYLIQERKRQLRRTPEMRCKHGVRLYQRRCRKCDSEEFDPNP